MSPPLRTSNEDPPIFYTAFNIRSGQVCPLLRASNDIHAPSKLARSLSRDGG